MPGRLGMNDVLNSQSYTQAAGGTDSARAVL